jgi:flagellin-specific chaperone FliS
MARPDHRYLQAKLRTATPEELTIITFDVLINSTSRAIVNLKAPVLDIQLIHNELRRAQRAAALLMGSLRFDVDEALAQSMFRIYEHWHHELYMANMNKSPDIIEQLLPAYKHLRATWIEAYRTARAQNAAPAPRSYEGGYVAVG